MEAHKKYLILALLLSMPGIAHAHNPAAAMLIMVGIYLIPGVVSALIVKRNGIVWFAASIPLAIFCIWMVIKSYVPFFVGSAIPFVLIPIAVWKNLRSASVSSE